jgi:hypothetical protein
VERLYCCLSHSTDRGRLQHAWREARLQVVAVAMPTVVSSNVHHVISLSCAPWFRQSSVVYGSNIPCWHMARVEARGMLPLGGQARPKGGYVTLHGLCAKLPVPAQTLTILRHNTNFFARHTPHSHTHLDADIITFSLGDNANPCCFFAKLPDIAWFICHCHQACHTQSGLVVYSESARALLLNRLRSNTSKKKEKTLETPFAIHACATIHRPTCPVIPIP